MYQFVEYLRARRALFIISIIIGIVLLIALALRLYAIGRTTEDWVSNVQHSPTAHVTQQQLRDGSTRIVVDDPAERTHALIVRKGSAFRMDLTEPSGSATRHGTMSMGETKTNETVKNGISHVTVSSRSGSSHLSFELGWLFVASIPLGLIAATLLGGVLAKENAGHLELAWTKPISRERYALSAAGIDIAAIVLSQIAGVLGALLCMLLFVVPGLTLSAETGGLIAVAFLGPIAWYAMLTGLSASTRAVGTIIGVSWAVALIIPGIAHATAHVQLGLVQGIHAIAQAVTYIDPLGYISVNGGSFASNGLIHTMSGTMVALLVLTVLYLAAAVLQWRRLEA